MLAQKSMNARETYAVRLVEQLPEVKAFYSSIKDTAVHGCILTAGMPGKTSRYFHFEVGVITPYLFDTRYNFYVDSRTYQVKYYSPGRDTIISLQYWRKHKDKY